MVVGGGRDYGKRFFTMLMTLHIKLHDIVKNLYLDEVIRVI